MKIKIGKLLNKQFDDNKFVRYDLIIKYLFIEKFYNDGKPEKFKFKLYNKLIKARHRKYNKDNFISIIKSFEKNGLDKKYPIIIGSDYFIRDGTHRLAACLWFDIDEIFANKEERKGKKIFTKEWMLKNGFKKKMSLIKNTKSKIFKRFE